MSAPAGTRKRPLGVTVIALAIAVTGLVDLLRGATEPAYVLVGLGIVQLALALLLWRGANVARLAVTLVLLVRLAYASFLVTEREGHWSQAGLTLVITVAALVLLWNRAASAYFEPDREHALADSLDQAAHGPRRGAGVPRVLDFVARLVVLTATIALSPGIAATTWWSLLLGVVAVALAGWALRPLLVRIAGLFGWLGALLMALFANAAVIGVGLYLTPGMVVESVGAAILASWVYAVLMTLIGWVLSVSTQDYLTVHAARMSLRNATAERSDVPGVLFVQLDGVPGPVLENEVRAGNLPTISRWIRSGSHTWDEWTARVPSTTPVSQAGLLHGNSGEIPAFRWYDRELGRMIVANRPSDAAIIEARASNGRGLLADDGVSISNLFSGDAPTSLLTMSGLRNRTQGLGPSQSYAAFFTHPAGFVRAIILTIGEMVKERFQARRQVVRGVQPRIDRHGSYVVLRALTNVFLRDLNVALVVEAMMRGARSVYVDFVDYDEIAHHAGVTRPESLAAIYGLDDVLRSLESIATSDLVPRPYHIVLVSDHGQSQGATFRQRYGITLEQLVASHMSGRGQVAAATDEVEAYGPVNVFLGQLSGQDSVSGRLTRRALGEREAEAPLGPPTGPDTPEPPRDEHGLAVVGSGNLGGIWFTGHDQRLQLPEMEALHPGLVQALADHPGIGFVVVMAATGPVAIGAAGTHDLTSGDVVGEDPLTLFGPAARGDFLRAASFRSAPDIYVNSLYDPVLDEVAAFEELVGCHGGLGGWQTLPILVHPADWLIDPALLDESGRLHGADNVHRQLVRWLEDLGHRTSLSEPVVLPTQPTAPPSPVGGRG